MTTKCVTINQTSMKRKFVGKMTSAKNQKNVTKQRSIAKRKERNIARKKRKFASLFQKDHEAQEVQKVKEDQWDQWDQKERLENVDQKDVLGRKESKAAKVNTENVDQKD